MKPTADGRNGPRWPVAAVAAATTVASLAMLAGGREIRPPTPLTPRTIDLDRADAVDLELLPGIGPSLAARIVSDRAANGPFGSPEALTRVRGVGPAIVEGIQPHVRGGPNADRDDG